MKRLYVSADIEGVCGIADWKETELESPQNAYFRDEMTREVKAACEAAIEAGVEDILVKDAHSTGRNIDPRALPERARILRAWTRDPHSMMAGIDGGFDAALLVGYHSGGGSDGNPLAHTMNTDNVRVLVNGAEASEFLINAYTAASVGVPVVAVSGDRALCEAAKAYDPRIETAAVSEGRGNASLSIHPRLADQAIREAVGRALRGFGAGGPAPLPPSFEVGIEFRQHFRAYRGSFYPGAERAGNHAVRFRASRWSEALTFLFWVL